MPTCARRSPTCPAWCFSVGQPIAHRLDHLLSGVRAQVAVKIFGRGPRRAARAGRGGSAPRWPGSRASSTSQVEAQMLVPQVQVIADRERRSPTAWPRARSTSSWRPRSGDHGGHGARGTGALDVVVRLPEEARADAARLADLPIDTPQGGRVALAALADVRAGSGRTRSSARGPSAASRSWPTWPVATWAVVRGRRGALARDVPMPQGYRLELGGQFESQRGGAAHAAPARRWSHWRSSRRSSTAHFRSTARAAGAAQRADRAASARWRRSAPLGRRSRSRRWSASSRVAGIASRNGMMMVSHYLHLIDFEGGPSTEDDRARLAGAARAGPHDGAHRGAGAGPAGPRPRAAGQGDPAPSRS